jgi:A118 family predicted phage portal protein
MNYTKMYEALRKVLGNEQIDFAMSGRSSALIELWSRMYEEKAPWLHNTDNANIPATIAGEIARLTTLELQSKVEGSPRAECMDAVYQQALGKLRVQTEYAFAKGSMVFKPYITPDGTIAIQYIQADMFFPLDYDSEKMTRCAFLDQFRKGNEIYSRIELYSMSGDSLSIKNRVFIARTEGTLGTEVPVGTVPRWAELAEEMGCPVFLENDVNAAALGEFQNSTVPLGNSRDSGSPLGVSVYSRAIKQIEDADRRYSQINWEYDSKETAVHIAQSLLKYNPDTNSYEYPGGKERLYRGVFCAIDKETEGFLYK